MQQNLMLSGVLQKSGLSEDGQYIKYRMHAINYILIHYIMHTTTRYDVICKGIATADFRCICMTWHNTPKCTIVTIVCTIVYRYALLYHHGGIYLDTARSPEDISRHDGHNISRVLAQQFSPDIPQVARTFSDMFGCPWGCHCLAQNLWIWNLRTSWLQKIYHQSWTASTTTTLCHTRLLDSLAGRALLALCQLGSAWYYNLIILNSRFELCFAIGRYWPLAFHHSDISGNYWISACWERDLSRIL